MAYYIDKNSIKIEPTADPAIYTVSADMTTDEVLSDWEKPFVSVTVVVNRNDTAANPVMMLRNEYKRMRETSAEQNTDIAAILTRITGNAYTKEFTRTDPDPPAPEPQHVKIVAVESGVLFPEA